jgi:hypothetical protein
MAAAHQTPPVDPGSLIEVETERQSRGQQVFRTPSIEVKIHRENGRLIAKGTDLRAVVIKSPAAPSVPMLKRGIEGRVGDRPLRIHRPRYGLRRRHRTIVIESDGIRWHTQYRKHGHYDIVRSADDAVLYRRAGRRQFVNADASGEEVSLALAVAASGIVGSSSLSFYLSL